MEQKNRDDQKYRDYLRKHGYSEKALSHYSFDKLQDLYNSEKEKVVEKFVKENEEAEKIEELKGKFGGMCEYLLDKGMKPAVVENLSKESVLDQYNKLKRKETLKRLQPEPSTKQSEPSDEPHAKKRRIQTLREKQKKQGEKEKYEKVPVVEKQILEKSNSEPEDERIIPWENKEMINILKGIMINQRIMDEASFNAIEKIDLKELFYLKKAEWVKALREVENPRSFVDGRFVPAGLSNNTGIEKMMILLNELVGQDLVELANLPPKMVTSIYIKTFNFGPSKPKKFILFRHPISRRHPQGERGESSRSVPHRTTRPQSNLDLPRELYYDSVTESLKVIMESRLLRDIVVRSDFYEYTQVQLERMARLNLSDYRNKNRMAGRQMNDLSKYLKNEAEKGFSFLKEKRSWKMIQLHKSRRREKYKKMDSAELYYKIRIPCRT
ncbi:uncharacterized protein LOC143600572 [Bidens hawaiensis]|uniref:uncharacterized protein LOC143600572 n=1 Tax=Bidens hawaiensis TaxID=980011 RepID=UPI00404A6D2E